MALTPLYTTSIVYINRINRRKQREEERATGKREIKRRIFERYTIEESNWKKVIDCKKRKRSRNRLISVLT
jgi:hypothetical protein